MPSGAEARWMGLKFHVKSKPRLNTAHAAIATAAGSQRREGLTSNGVDHARPEGLDRSVVLGPCAGEYRLEGVLRISARPP